MSRYTALAVVASLVAAPATVSAQTANGPSKPGLFPYNCSVVTLNVTTDNDGSHVNVVTAVSPVQTVKDCVAKFDAATNAILKSMQVITRGDHTSVAEAFASRTRDGRYEVEVATANRPLGEGETYFREKVRKFLADYRNNK